MRRVTGWAVLPEAPTASHRALLGAHLAHISTGNAGKARVGAGIQKGLFCRCFLPFRALRYPLIPTLNRLDKAEVTGSSPVSPMTVVCMRIDESPMREGRGSVQGPKLLTSSVGAFNWSLP